VSVTEEKNAVSYIGYKSEEKNLDPKENE